MLKKKTAYISSDTININLIFKYTVIVLKKGKRNKEIVQ